VIIESLDYRHAGSGTPHNVACLKGVSSFDFADVPVIDGVNHPSDHGRGYEIVGHLRFIPTENRSAAGGDSIELLRMMQTSAWRGLAKPTEVSAAMSAIAPLSADWQK
jgi:hypothetical protein